MKGAEGRLIRKNGIGVINAVPSELYPGKTRFTVAHELGHWELHENTSQFLCNEEDMRDYGRSPMEIEANHFAAELLMPTFYFRKSCGREFPSFELIGKLAAEFESTLTATAIRYVDISRHKIVLVWTYNGVVRWSYSRAEFKLPFVLTNRPPPPFSSATVDESDAREELDRYEDANWFPELSRVPEVLELTKRMNNLDAGLTVLYFP
ncbi:ImmA/IrrE family metallo-endopeptidase [Pelagicoccus sp. SDUM812002]|uniref:ImmA/IrrE family metallo-endopeptidase n=1 Tax=Pelagicoccus sp. SDUM812002 TaxID=3041266 RepID=UPI00281004BC|nr:ImmA/IrrE family metallo-endopeptidase [Pelagicoccus sp. SDUM812002]MDQ8184268.1 ImmA/IrrE family metallo-endopeptidase [Pelagicoccus sp. SDUM812002]